MRTDSTHFFKNFWTELWTTIWTRIDSRFWIELRTEVFLKNQFKILIRVENWTLIRLFKEPFEQELRTRTDLIRFFKNFEPHFLKESLKTTFLKNLWSDFWTRTENWTFPKTLNRNLNKNWFNSLFKEPFQIFGMVIWSKLWSELIQQPIQDFDQTFEQELILQNFWTELWSELRTRIFKKNWFKILNLFLIRTLIRIDSTTNSSYLSRSFDNNWELKSIQNFWTELRTEIFEKNQFKILIKFSSKIFKFYVGICRWEILRIERRGLVGKCENEISKKTDVWECKTLIRNASFHTYQLYLVLLNFGLEFFHCFFKKSILKSKMYFLVV